MVYGIPLTKYQAERAKAEEEAAAAAAAAAAEAQVALSNSTYTHTCSHVCEICIHTYMYTGKLT